MLDDHFSQLEAFSKNKNSIHIESTLNHFNDINKNILLLTSENIDFKNHDLYKLSLTSKIAEIAYHMTQEDISRMMSYYKQISDIKNLQELIALNTNNAKQN